MSQGPPESAPSSTDGTPDPITYPETNPPLGRNHNPSLLQIDGVSKSYGQKRVLKDIAFRVSCGEIVGFVGPNGAGKSTTLRIIAGLVTPDAGHVVISNATLAEAPRHYRGHLGVLLESPSYYPTMTAREHLVFLSRLGTCHRGNLVTETLDCVGLARYGDKRVGAFSAGMKQRLAIAMAILNQPRLLLLDEPTNGLDPAAVLEVRALITRLAASEGMAILISSHLLHEIQQICTRVLFIRAGEMVLPRSPSGEPSQPPVTFVTSDPTATATTIRRLFRASDVEIADAGVTCNLCDQNVAVAVAALVQEAVNVFEVHRKCERLEDVYLDTLGRSPDVQ